MKRTTTNILSLALALLLAVGLAAPALAARPGPRRPQNARPATAFAATAQKTGFSAELVRISQTEITPATTGEGGAVVPGKDRVTLMVTREETAAPGWKAVYKLGEGEPVTTPAATGQSLTFHVEVEGTVQLSLLRIIDGAGQTLGEVNKSLTLNKATAYSLSYHLNGGTGTLPAAQTGALLTADSGAALSREGHVFSHWSTQKDGGGTRYNPGQAVPLTADLTLYAQWQAVKPKFTLTYDASGGQKAPEAVTAEQGQELTVAGAGSMTRTGFVFTGWNTRSDGTGSAVAVGDKLTLTENLTLYAQWQAEPKAPAFKVKTGVSIKLGESIDLKTLIENLDPASATLSFYSDAKAGVKIPATATPKEAGEAVYYVVAEQDGLKTGPVKIALTVEAPPKVTLAGLGKGDKAEVKKGESINLTSFIKTESGYSYKFYTRTTNLLKTVQYKQIANPTSYKPAGSETIYVQATDDKTGATSDYQSFDVVLSSVTIELDSITPADEATGVAVNLADIELIFSDTAAISNANGIVLKIKDGATVSLTKSALEKTVTLVPQGLLSYGTEYELTIAEDAIEGYAGGIFGFTTEAIPTYTTAPAGNNVSTTAAVKITFNKAVHLSAGKNLSGVTIKKNGSGSNLATEVKFDNDKKVLTLSHSAFAANTSYTVTIPGGTLHGFAEDITYTFKTVTGYHVPVYHGAGPEADSSNYLLEQMAQTAYNNLYVDILEAKAGETLSFNATTYNEIPFWVIDKLAGKNIKLALTYSDGGSQRTATINCARIPRTAKHRIFFRAADLVKLYA